MDITRDTVYLIRPRPGAGSAELLVETEDKQTVLHVQYRENATTHDKTYRVCDATMKELLTTQVEESGVLARYAMVQDARAVAHVGQLSVVPEKYFLKLERTAQLDAHIGGFEGIYRLKNSREDVAEIAQHRATWIVVISAEEHCFLILAAIAIIYAESSL